MADIPYEPGGFHELMSELTHRDPETHKGDFGRALVVGGTRGMIGAPALAAEAALRGGAGLVCIATPEPIQLTVASLCPCATSIPLKCRPNGTPGPSAVGQVLDEAGRADVLAVGPGMGTSGGAVAIVRAVLAQDRPLVLDADGLNCLCRIDHWAEFRRCPIVLTPHPGELSRLTGAATGAIQAEREQAATDAAGEWIDQAQTDAPLVLVLKGAGTVVTDGSSIFINESGNPGMATGGSGDVLTGLVAALIGQGLTLMDATCVGVHVHGLAGDLAAEEIGEVSLIASDIVDFLPDAFWQGPE